MIVDRVNMSTRLLIMLYMTSLQLEILSQHMSMQMQRYNALDYSKAVRFIASPITIYNLPGDPDSTPVSRGVTHSITL
jgi:hypothetical protein